MTTIRNHEIYAEDPAVQPGVLVAMADLRRQRWPQDVGRMLYDLNEAIRAQVKYVGEERQRLLEVHAKRNEQGEPVKVEKWEDLKNRRAFEADFQAVMDATFEVKGFPWSKASGKDLLGDTWAAPIWEFDVPPAGEKKVPPASADGGGSGGGSEGADN